MSRRFELGMSMEYVGNWGITEAVREIFQNCYDEEIVNPENKMLCEYNEELQVLRIGNRNSTLSTKTLLLGCSSKRDDERTIGTHGEGYKVATIVLLRNNIGIRILNYNDREVWTAKVVNSKRYGCPIGVYDIEQLGVFKKQPEFNLVFELTGITKEMYDLIKENNLHLQDDLGEVYNGNSGRCLLDEKFKGKIYVNGLFVCTNPNLTYGYDIVANLVKLDRDRGLIDSFDLQWTLGRGIYETGNLDFINSVKSTWDGVYIRIYMASVTSDKSVNKAIYFDSYEKFREKYGNDAVAVNSTDEFNILKKQGYNPVMVRDSDYHYITNCPEYTTVSIEPITKDSVLKSLDDWYNKYYTYLPTEALDSFNDIIENLKCLL